MSVLGPLNTLVAGDILGLIGRSETLTLDFKVSITDPKDLLEDIVALANRNGGDIVIGVEEGKGEQKGVAVAIPGIAAGDKDALLLGITSSVQDNIEPRLITNVQAVTMTESTYCLVVRVPRSREKPHAVRSGKRYTFTVCNNTGNTPMDIRQIRSAFIASDDNVTRMRQFRDRRLAEIAIDESRVPKKANWRLIVHAIPEATFDDGMTVELSKALQAQHHGMLDNTWGVNNRFNFDGLLFESVFTNPDAPHAKLSYAQFYREGIVEAVHAETYAQGQSIDGISFMRSLSSRVRSLLGMFKILGIDSPVYVFCAIDGMLGRTISNHPHPLTTFLGGTLIDRNTLVLPDIRLDDFDADLIDAMKPWFDVLWQSAGKARCPYYDDLGKSTLPAVMY